MRRLIQLSPLSLRRGAAYGLCCVAAVAVVYLLAAALPATRSAFLDERYRADLGAALGTALVVIPLGTILFEEVAFRGVLWGLVRAEWGGARATLVSSGLFVRPCAQPRAPYAVSSCPGIPNFRTRMVPSGR